MAQFSAKKIDTNTINGGQQVVNGSGVTPELFNAPVESALYTEKAIEVLTSTVDVSQANAVGTPTVSFSSKTEGGVEYKYLKFSNLKGETGPQGPRGEKGETGTAGADGAAGLNGNDGKNGLEYLGNVVQYSTADDVFVGYNYFDTGLFNRTPVPDDSFLYICHIQDSDLSYIANGKVLSVQDFKCTVRTPSTASQLITGPKGETGETGATGEAGKTGKDGLSIYLYDGELSSTVKYADTTKINVPSGRSLSIGDILFSTNESTYGAMSVLKSLDSSVVFIGNVAGCRCDSGGGSGGGSTDVQINGTSIVSDGVANIPYADDTKAGVLSTQSQTISGYKTFYNTPSAVGGLKCLYSKTSTTQGGKISARSYGLDFLCNTSTSNSAFTFANSNSVSDANLEENGYLTYKPKSVNITIGAYNNIPSFDIIQQGTTTTLKMPDRFAGFNSGTLMVTPTTWSTGTSGSVTLPNAGLYEVKVTKPFGEYNVDITAFVNFAKDGTKGAQSTSISYNNAGQLTTTFIVVDPTGVMTFLDPSTMEGDTSITISYRKIGIA